MLVPPLIMQWFFANYLYALALEKTTVAMVNTLSATSGVIVMCLAAIPFLSTTEGDKLTIPRCLVTLLRLAKGPLITTSISPSPPSFPLLLILGHQCLLAVC